MQLSMEWRRSGSPRPKYSECEKRTRKFIASIFWYQDVTFIIDYLPKSQPNSTEYYLNLQVQLKDILKEKCCGNFIGVPFSCTTIPRITGHLQTQKILAYLGFHCLAHPPYSPDLAPLDSQLFPLLKMKLKFPHFSSDIEVNPAAEIWLAGQILKILSDLHDIHQWAMKFNVLRVDCCTLNPILFAFQAKDL